MRVWFSPIPVIAAALLVLVVLIVLAVIDRDRARSWARWLIGPTVVGILAVTMLGTTCCSTGSASCSERSPWC